jgi:palmitoyltransferase ZDHHC13/17
LAGIFAASLFLLAVRWLTTILPGELPCTLFRADPFTNLVIFQGTISDHPLINLLFAILLAMVAYFYAVSMMFDPGHVPKLNGIAEQKAAIDDLLALWKFDEANFCVTCMIRTPLRSKHCKRCQRCVAKHDQ